MSGRTDRTRRIEQGAAGSVAASSPRIVEPGRRRFSGTTPMLVVCAVHAGVLIALEAVQRPAAVALVLVGLIAVHLAFAAAGTDRWSVLVRDGASQVAAGAVVALDGGTESPFFFWVLLFLAGQALRHTSRDLAGLAGLALAMYAGVVVVTGDLTASSAGRFGLLVAFCAALVYLRRVLDHQQRAMRRLDAVLRAAFDAAPIGGALVDEDLEIHYANHRAAELFAHLSDAESEARIVSSTGEVMDFETAAKRGFAEEMTEPSLIRVEDGPSVRHVRVLWVPVDIEGRRLLLVFAEDVSLQVAAGEERTRFLEAAAHQFRTPLTPVMGYAQMLADGELAGEDVATAGAMINRGARDIERVLEKLSALLRMRSSDPPAPRLLSLDELTEALRSAVSDLDGDLRFVGDPGVRILCAPEPVVLAFAELVRNGVLHGVPPVVISWSAAGGEVEVNVSDGGDGPALVHGARLAGVWVTDYRSLAVSEQMGTQLGLAQAAQLVQLAGGTLEFVRGDGWCFAARFPSTSG